MKKWLFFLFGSMLLCSCSCLLSQIPPQYIFAGAGCTVPLPDYKTQVIVTGGCTGFTVSQTPLPGFLLTAVNKEVTVEIKAVGANLKSSKVSFLVTMLDTLTPKITPLPSLLSYEMKQIKDMYDAADKMTILSFKQFDDNFPWEQNGSMGPNAEGDMLVTVSMDSAGERNRFITMTDLVAIGGDTSKIYWNEIGEKPTEFIPMSHVHGWEQIIHPVYLDNDALRYPVSYNDFMDWQAVFEYMPIPARTPTASPDLSLVKATTNFTPLVYDPVAKKMKFWNGTVWKTLTSN